MHENHQQTRVTVLDEAKPVAVPPVDMGKLTDEQGRVFEIKVPDILMQARFERLFGDDNANYRLIMGALTWVRSINGEAVFQPASLLAYEALLQRVGEHALSAIVARIGEIQADEDDGADERAEIKNS